MRSLPFLAGLVWSASVRDLKSLSASSNSMTCTPPSSIDGQFEGFVLNGLCGTYHGECNRCATVIRPSGKMNLGVLMCYHGTTPSAGVADNTCAIATDSDGHSLGMLAMGSVDGYDGFALVVMQQAPDDSVWDQTGSGGPTNERKNPAPMFTAETGTNCSDSYTYETEYNRAIMTALESYSSIDTSRAYVFGSSAGAETAAYAATCLRETMAGVNVPSFGISGSGLHDAGGEYFPIYPKKVKNFKLCAVDGTDDPYKPQVEAFVEKWKELGNEYWYKYYEGLTHGDSSSRSDIVTCLDNGTGNLGVNNSTKRASR